MEGHSLNDKPRLAKVVAATLSDLLEQEPPTSEQLLNFLNGNQGRKEIMQALDGLQQIGVHGIPKFIIEGSYVVDGAAHSDVFVEIFREIEARGEIKGGPVFGDVLGVSEATVANGSHLPRHIPESA